MHRYSDRVEMFVCAVLMIAIVVVCGGAILRPIEPQFDRKELARLAGQASEQCITQSGKIAYKLPR